MLNPKKTVGTTILALFVLVWVAYHVSWIRERRAVLNAPEKYHVFQAASNVAVSRSGEPIEFPVTTNAPWPLGWLGEQGQLVLGMNASKSAAEIARIRELFPEAEIELVPADDIDPALLVGAVDGKVGTP